MTDFTPFPRHFLAKELQINSWADLKSYADNLEQRDFNTMEDFKKFLDDYNEFDRVVTDDYWWRYINVTRYTNDDALEKKFNDFTTHITPVWDQWKDAINQKIVASPFAERIEEPGFSLMLRNLRTKIDLFNEKNLALRSREEELISEYGKVTGAMMAHVDGKDMTFPEVSGRLYLVDREKREEAWLAINERRYQSHEEINKLYDEIVHVRHQMALNSGFENYRDYMFKFYYRDDYSPKDCYDFYNSAKQFSTPLMEKIQARKAKALGLDKLRPWDLNADSEKREPLKAYNTIDDLLEKTLQVAGNIDPVFRDTLQVMMDRGNLDLETRKNKRAGGYNQEFLESNVSFVFGNFTNQLQDIVTLLHELGHGVHNTMCIGLDMNAYRMPAIETAELASMTLELITMDQWNIYFPDNEELIRAKRTQLERTITVLQGVVPVDIFQHEIYQHPEKASAQSGKVWKDTIDPVTSNVVDWSGLEKYREHGWQAIHHVFDHPLYYIEYGFAQLGALQIWRNYKKDPKKAIEQYKYALSLGSTKSIPEIYEAAGIKFDFSADTIRELMQFAEQELDALN